MDAFRSIPMNLMAMATEPRITTSNIYHIKPKAEKMARLRGLDKLFYNMNIDSHAVEENEVNMLSKLRSAHWKTLLQMFEPLPSE